MRKIIIAILAVLFFVSCAGRSDKSCETYAEAADPAESVVDWSGVDGLNVSFGSIDNRYAKGEIPEVTPTVAWEGVGWRGERLSAQIALWTDKDIEQVEFDFSPFKSKGGVTIDASIAQVRFVRYVLTDEFADGCGYRKPENFAESLSADVLDNVDCLNIEANTTQPVWLTFSIPEEAEPGLYSGKLYMYAKGEKRKKMNISLEVLDQVLPPAKEWALHVDLWQHPSAVARIHDVPLWSEEHFELLDAPMKMLADMGQKVITATMNKDPWNNQCYDPYEEMIIWTKKKDGSWEYDYTVFDKWVTYMMDLGIDQQINCYSMIPWRYQIQYRDEASGEIINESAKPEAKIFTELWEPFLISFKKHLEEKGWLEITNIAMDERAPQDMKLTQELLKRVAPEFGIALADNHKSYKEYPMLRDICLSHGEVFDEEDLQFRKDSGLVSTYYICCAHKFPSIFTFSDPAEGAFIGWYAVAAGFDGFLHWSYNSWVEDPLRDSRFRTWPAGDTFIIYPGGRGSIRYERMLQGFQDAEKIRILREKLAAENDSEKLEMLNAGVANFNTIAIPETPCGDMIAEGQKLLNNLSR